MDLLLAVAVMAVAVASWIIATTFRIRIRENMTDVAQARKLVQQCSERLRQAEKRLRTQSDHDQARWADEFETVRQQIGEAHVQLARHDAQIRQHQDRLDEQGAAARPAGPTQQEMAALQQAIREFECRPGHRVLAGGICTEATSAADLLPLLYDSFLRQLPLDRLFNDAGRYYLLWRSPNGQPVQQRLAELLRACPDPAHPPIPGLTELRSLLLALHHAGPATMQAGPLVVFRTSDQFAGLVLAASEADVIDGQSALPAPEECRSLLKTLGEDRLTDLGAWADRNRA